MHPIQILTCLICALFCGQVQSAPAQSIPAIQSATYTARKIFEFPNSSFVDIENVAIRANGVLLLSVITAPQVYTLDPSQSNPSAQLLHTFPDATSCLGITQTAPDVFAIVVGNVSVTTFMGVPGTFAIWSMNLSGSTPTFTKIAAIPAAKILNGMTHVQSNSNIVLAAGSETGIVYSLNVNTGTYQVAAQNPAFNPTTAFPLGINGIKTLGNVLYFTNSALGTFGSLPIDAQGQSSGSVSIIAHDVAGYIYDDFALDSSGNAFIANHPDAVSEVLTSGSQMTILNSTQLVQPTSAIFANTGTTLYVVTAGEASGNSITSGQVFELTPS